eukprot:CAMPEP_0118909518 /NCGR_PEP_ID=MMETSP1166-20130328/12061_1 /TAXON_ID=1104430 /ORGANISM="Chrysoreinhardia sp, Strain CCMP3193" /LENGTH=297 /DNA_ID=CAMNT_0006848955 /DNA_START=40 /DNA_END=933 /DNA_ORIENTATION=-
MALKLCVFFFVVAPLASTNGLLGSVCPNGSFALPLRRRSDDDVLARYESTGWAERLASYAEDSGRALEIGGPTDFVRGLYTLPWASFDVANLAQAPQLTKHRATNGAPIRDGALFYVDGQPRGRLVEVDGVDLDIDSGALDVVLAFHTLEHFPQPLTALREWRRVLRRGGALVIIVPYAPATYDHAVPPSTFYDLLLDDHLDDPTHLEARVRAYAALVNRSRGYACDDTPQPGHIDNDASFATAALNAPCHHWHVWNFALLEDVMACLGFRISHMALLDNWHQFIFAEKLSALVGDR